MDDLFQNPLGASVGIRDFWSRWNCAVKTSLARAVFKLLQSQDSAPVSRRLRKDLANASERFRSGTTRKGGKRYVDAFDETETELDSAPPSAATSPVGTDDEGDGPRRSARRRNNAAGRQMGMTPAAPSKPRPNGTSKDRGAKQKKPGQLIKVFAALSTFFVSGAFHEEMIWACFPRHAQIPGLQMAFFMSHGVVMCLTTVVARKYPGLVPSNPWLGWLGVQIFLWLTTPLFTAPFARYGFFEHLKAMSVFNWHSLHQRAGPVAGFVHLVKIR